MPKVPYKMPNVFVGCPYGKGFDFASFKKALDRLPLRWHYADTHVRTRHLLSILRTYIKTADFCVFDISLWNANVALEIGLAEGMNVEYYILLNRTLTKGVPADIQGIQRIEYGSYAPPPDPDSLTPLIDRHLVRTKTHPRNIHDDLSGESKEAKYFFAMGILSHLRDNSRLTASDISRLARGSYLRQDGKDAVLDMLERSEFLAERRARRGAKLAKTIYKGPIKP